MRSNDGAIRLSAERRPNRRADTMVNPLRGGGTDGGESCRICGGSTVLAFSARDRKRRLSEDVFRYLRCHRCGTVALANVPRDLGAFYSSDYYRLPGNREQLLALAGPAEREKLALVQTFAPGRHLLEIGPAAGAFLGVAQSAGYNVEAIEMDEGCCRFIERELGVTAKHSDAPATAVSGSGPFDAIMMWHVIEHLRDPRAVIAAAALSLAPGGVLIIGTPNPEALELRVLGSRWVHVDAPRHLFLIPLWSAVRLGIDHGLELVFYTSNGPGAIDYARGGWCESLMALVESDGAKHTMRLAGGALVRLLSPIERRGLHGSTYTLLLRRRIDT